jgi:hypothetical protein
MEHSRRFLRDWEAAVHERDIAAIDRLLAADFELVSPVAHKPYTDRRMCLAILQAVLRTLPDLVYTRREAFPGGTLLVFRGTVDGLTLEGVDLFDLDADGRARRLTVLVRPLKAATAFAQRMGAELAAGS